MYGRPGNPVEPRIPNVAFQIVATVAPGTAQYVAVTGTESNVGREWLFYCPSAGAQIFWGPSGTLPATAAQGMPLAANTYLPWTIVAPGVVIYNASATALDVSVAALG